MSSSVTWADRLVLFLKGVAMGAADVVPGVSGGTIAFITGIYDELLNSIRSANLKAIQLLLRGRFAALSAHLNLPFLLVLGSGIALSLLSLSKLVLYLMEHQPILLWSFFFGLVLASIWTVSKQIDRFRVGLLSMFVLGTVVAFWITTVSPSHTPETWWFIILSGAIAICAMILPGISGSFILLLMGKYRFILEALNEFRLDIILLFSVGMVTGITSFSHVLHWLLQRYRNLTIAVLAGFMLGSLNKVWPWKIPLKTYVDSSGKVHPLTERNLWPGTYESVTGFPAEWGMALLVALLGAALVLLLERLGSRNEG
jgi:putative membrane protein